MLNFLGYCYKVFGVTPHQEAQAKNFISEHNKNCPKVSIQQRDFIANEEQATIQSTYGYSFVENGIGYNVEIFCTFCKASGSLHMHEFEMDKFLA